MNFKEWSAVIQLAGVAVITAWLGWDAANGRFAGLGAQAVATKLLWVVGAVIVFNIAATIVVTIIVSIARREELRDETDERDRGIADRSNRNGYLVTSITAALGLVALAFGQDAIVAVYLLFVAPMLGGTVESASRLIYYRIG